MRSSRRPTRSISASRRVCLAFSRRLRSGLSCCCGEYPGQTCSRTARDHTRRQLTQRMQSRSVVPGPANVPIKRGGLRLAILHAQARAHKALAQPHIYGCTERLCARGPARIAAPLRHAKTQEECLIYPAHPRDSLRHPHKSRQNRHKTPAHTLSAAQL